MKPALVEQSAVNREAFHYSKELLRQDPGEVSEVVFEEEKYRSAVRDQGFRRAVVTAYAHRCAFCGVRVLTIDGHTAVEASHIVPWSLSRDDRPANGLSLCRLCHWGFDESLLRISAGYEISTSPQLTSLDNLPGYLTNLKGRGLFHPLDEIYRPDPASLKWHHENVFRA